MFCYKCGCELNSGNRCPNCGSDVQQYKKIIYTSNYLYNEGLAKAGVKDLSGAIIALKDAIWYNKNNLDARNLLGLCYYEIGETVAALSEWILSKNINDNGPKVKDNAADRYIAEIQASAQLVSNQSAAIQRYNHALECCRSDNLDVAVLQLRKVLSLNSHYLRARQLLSLIYIEQQQWAKAQKELRKCQLLDVNNTTTLRYLNEVESKLSSDAGDARGKKKSGSSNAAVRVLPGKSGRSKKVQAEGGVIKYTADNETIIQPAGSRIPGVDGFGFPTAIAGGVIGLLVGAALVAFLVMPTRVALVRSDAANQVREVSSQLDSKESEIADLTSQLEELQSSGGLASGDLSDDEAAQVNALLAAANAYLADSSNDDGSVTEAFAQINHQQVSGYSEAYQTLYNTLKAAIGSDMLDYYYLAGSGAYEAASPDYDTTITNLENALLFDDADNPCQARPQILYYLGDAYYRSYLQGESADTSAAASSETASEGDSTAEGDAAVAATTTSTASKDNYIAKAETYLGEVVNNYASSSYASRAWADINAIAADETLKALAGDAFIEANTDAAATTADTVETDTAASEADAETGTVTPDTTSSSTAASTTSQTSNSTATTTPAETTVDNSAAEAEAAAAAAAAAAAQQEAERTAAAQAAYAQAIANGASSEEAMAAANAAIGN